MAGCSKIKALNLPIEKNLLIAGSLKCCGIWLPDDKKKANMYVAWKGKMVWLLADILPLLLHGPNIITHIFPGPLPPFFLNHYPNFSWANTPNFLRPEPPVPPGPLLALPILFGPPRSPYYS